MDAEADPGQPQRERLVTVRFSQAVLGRLPRSIQTLALFLMMPLLLAEAAIRGGAAPRQGPGAR